MKYRINDVSPMDAYAAFQCEGDRAQRDQMTGTAARQHAMALHLKNASRQMVELCPNGFRVQMDIVFKCVPQVNRVARD